MGSHKLNKLDLLSVTNYEFERNSTPANHCVSPSSNVMLMNSFLDFIYAQALLEVKHLVIRKHCFKCLNDYFTQHDCIMSDLFYDDNCAIGIYFEEMLSEVDENKIILSWEKMVRKLNISSDIVELHKKVVSSVEYLAVMKTEQWKKKIKKTMQVILNTEHRLFSGC